MAHMMRAVREFLSDGDSAVPGRPRPSRTCPCCGSRTARPVGRRAVLRSAGLAAPMLALRPGFSRAAGGKYQAMILACIDPRMHEPVRDFAVRHGLIGDYSQFTIAGAAIGVVAPAFAKWHETFWENLAASIKLHSIESVIAIDHRDCGAAKIAYGDDCCSSPDKENATHQAALAQFRQEVGQRHPNLRVETMLMALDGTFIPLG
jgi:carbonic anhydrase